MKEMTARQREVLAFIRSFTERHGAPPTVREIGERFGFTARAAFDHLRALERKGMLQRRVTDKRVSRTLVLTAAPGAGRRSTCARCPCWGASPRAPRSTRRRTAEGTHPAAARSGWTARARTCSPCGCAGRA